MEELDDNCGDGSSRTRSQFGDATATSTGGASLRSATNPRVVNAVGAMPFHAASISGAQASDWEVGSSRFDDATEVSSLLDTADPSITVASSHGTGTRICWTDEGAERILMETLLCDETPQNVLELRRQWPALCFDQHVEVPDTRQLNLVLYKLRDERKIDQWPPNGTNQKPCWTKRHM